MSNYSSKSVIERIRGDAVCWATLQPCDFANAVQVIESRDVQRIKDLFDDEIRVHVECDNFLKAEELKKCRDGCLADCPVAPALHLNGTHRKVLIQQNTEVRRALRGALDALYEAAPHARDYYVQGADVFARAQAQFEANVARVQAVLAEYDNLYAQIADKDVQVVFAPMKSETSGQ